MSPQRPEDGDEEQDLMSLWPSGSGSFLLRSTMQVRILSAMPFQTTFCGSVAEKLGTVLLRLDKQGRYLSLLPYSIYTRVSRMVRQRTVNPWRKQLDVRSVPRVPFQMPDSYSGRLRLICNQEHFVPHSFESNIRLSFSKQDWQRSYAPPLQGGFTPMRVRHLAQFQDTSISWLQPTFRCVL